MIKNDQKSSVEDVFNALYKRFFVNGISRMMNRSVFLESILIQTLAPLVERFSFAQRAFSSPGQLIIG
jgi:hypothetical protein